MAKRVIIDGLEYALKSGAGGDERGEVVIIMEVKPVYRIYDPDAITISFPMPQTKLRPGTKLRIIVEE